MEPPVGRNVRNDLHKPGNLKLLLLLLQLLLSCCKPATPCRTFEVDVPPRDLGEVLPFA